MLVFKSRGLSLLKYHYSYFLLIGGLTERCYILSMVLLCPKIDGIRQQIHFFCLMWYVVKYFTTEHAICLSCSVVFTGWLLATLTSFLPLCSDTSHCSLRRSANSSFCLTVLLKHTVEFFTHAWHRMFSWTLRQWKPIQPPKCMALVCCVVEVPATQEVQSLL